MFKVFCAIFICVGLMLGQTPTQVDLSTQTKGTLPPTRVGNADWTYNNTAKWLGLGGVSPLGPFHAQNSGVNGLVYLDTYGSGYYGGLITRGARGTPGTPTAILTNDVLGVFGVRPYTGSVFTTTESGRVRFWAAGDISPSNHYTVFDIELTPSGSTTRGLAARIYPNMLELYSPDATQGGGLKIFGGTGGHPSWTFQPSSATFTLTPSSPTNALFQIRQAGFVIGKELYVNGDVAGDPGTAGQALLSGGAGAPVRWGTVASGGGSSEASSSFSFTPISVGTLGVAGPKTVTIATTARGLYGTTSAAGHYLTVSDGVNTEIVTITGGTCSPLVTTSCTLTFTTAQTLGTSTIASASGGLKEAVEYFGRAMGGGTVLVPVGTIELPPGGLVVPHDNIKLLCEAAPGSWFVNDASAGCKLIGQAATAPAIHLKGHGGEVTGLNILQKVIPISSVVNSGGKFRVTLSLASPLVDNQHVLVYGVTGTPEANGYWQVDQINSTTFDLVGSTFAGTTSSGGNMVVIGSAVPAIKVENADIYVNDNRISGWYHGIDIVGGVLQYVQRNRVNGAYPALGVGYHVGSGGGATNENYLNDNVMDLEPLIIGDITVCKSGSPPVGDTYQRCTAIQPLAGIKLTSSQGTYLTGNSIMHAKYGTLIDPATGKDVLYTRMEGRNLFDQSAENAIRVTCTNGGTVYGLSFNGVWTTPGTAGASGFKIDCPGLNIATPKVAGIKITNSTLTGLASTPLEISGAINVDVVGNQIWQGGGDHTGYGVNVDADLADGINITGNRIGTNGTGSMFAFGFTYPIRFWTDAANQLVNYNVTGNNLSGNANNVILDNVYSQSRGFHGNTPAVNNNFPTADQNFSYWSDPTYIIANYDSYDYFKYDRTNNLHEWFVNSVKKLEVGSAGVKVGSATSIPINGMLSSTATWSPGALVSGGVAATNITVTGCAIGDPVLVTHDKILNQAYQISATVSAADVITVLLRNAGGITATLASGTVRVTCIHY